jgi:C-terminal processing protease CtpA/Prc
MNTFRLTVIFSLGALLAHADLTQAQKVSDMTQLAAMYAKRYGPYEWKRDVIGFDLLNLQPWLTRAAQTKDDLEFYDLLIDYVASLNDAHDVFTLQSNFLAQLGFGTDIYDGKTLIDSIARSVLPAAQYPFQIGDELVSVDGKATADIIQAYRKYSIAANTRSTARDAAQFITIRPQSLIPRAHEIGDTAAVVIRRQSGDLETYNIPWIKRGTPLLNAGSPASPSGLGSSATARSRPRASDGDDTDDSDADPEYMNVLKELWNSTVPTSPAAVLNFGSIQPIFALPAGFRQRLGNGPADAFLTGTFQAGGFTIGFIRIPSFAPPSQTLAIQQLQQEVAFLQQNTDGLVIDDMRNPGGSVCYDETVASFFMRGTWRPLGFALRATDLWIEQFSGALTAAKRQNAPSYVIALYTQYLSAVQTAFAENRGMTGPLPLCTTTFDRPPALDARGNSIAYTKPLIVLTDEFSASGGDAFPAMIQDAQRGPIVGFRTMGAGGDVIDVPATAYSAGNTRVTESMMIRKNNTITSDFPPAPFVENIGVRPDIEIDYMTKDNLLQRGKPFVDAFTAVIVDLINKSK